jgi:hypothetical protein
MTKMLVLYYSMYGHVETLAEMVLMPRAAQRGVSGHIETRTEEV